MMDSFISRLDRFVRKYANTQFEDIPVFHFNDTTSIDAELAFQIHAVIQYKVKLQDMWEKESDYNRLLRQENFNLKEELDAIYQSYDDIDDETIDTISVTDGGEYLS